MSYPPDQRVQGCWEYMIQMHKHLIRKKFLSQRRDLLPSDVNSLSNLININLKQEAFFNKCENLVSFFAIDNEPNLLIPRNKKILLPKIDDEELSFHIKTDQLVTNKYGIKEPLNNESYPISEIQLILIPFIAFNTNLYRIGYGGGYYDRTLQKIATTKTGPKLWGVGYDFQKINTNFQNKFDIRLDKVITDKKVYV